MLVPFFRENQREHRVDIFEALEDADTLIITLHIHHAVNPS